MPSLSRTFTEKCPLPGRRRLARGAIGLALLLALGLALTCGRAAAEQHLVERIVPQVGQRGTTVDVTLEGHYLDPPRGLLCYRPGIRAVEFRPLEVQIDGRNGKQTPAEPGTRWQARLEIAADCPLGEHPLRLRTGRGLSELVSFYVTPLPVVEEAEPWSDANDTPSGAQSIPLGVSVWGQHPPSVVQDHDFYAIEARRGERISIEVVGDRLGTWHYAGMNDPAVRLLDRDGKLLAHSDDSSLFITDPVLSVVAPYDGRYTIDLHQQMDYETKERCYILHVGRWPRPLATYPLGGPAGEELHFRVLGDPLGPRSARLRLPTLSETLPRDVSVAGPLGEVSRRTAEGGYFDWYEASRESPSPNRLRVVDFANALEAEPNDTPRQAGSASPLPVALNGIIEREDDVDHFRFTARQGDRWFVRVYAAALGSPLDPRIWIARADTDERIALRGSAAGGGGNQRLADDDASWEGLERIGQAYRHQVQDRLDPHVVFTVPADGEYVLAVADTRAHFGPRHVYRVEFHPWREKIFTYLPPYPSQSRFTRDRIVVPRGASCPRNISLQKGLETNYDGPLRVEAIGLPAGVKLHVPLLYPGQTEFLALFEAEPRAELQHALIDLVVRPAEPQAVVEDRDAPASGPLASTFKQTVPNTERRGDYAMHFVFLEQLALATVEQPPFRLEIVQPTIPLARSGELSLEIRCHRQPGFEGEVYCEMDWLPPGVSKQTPLIIGADQSEALYRLNASDAARAGVYKLAITGRQNAGGDVRSGAGLDYVASKFIDLEVADPYVTVEIPRSAIERTRRTTIECRLKHHRPLPGKATATLKRLPTGVRVVEPLPNIEAGDERVTFTIEATADALLGQHKDVFCEVKIVEAGQEIRQQTGAGVLRIDPRRGGTAK